jgi:small-conductance mechanosensitive channel
MKNLLIILALLLLNYNLLSQNDSTTQKLQKFQILLGQLREDRYNDSLKKAELQYQYDRLHSDDYLERKRIQAEFKAINVKDSLRKADMIARAAYLRKSSFGYPVILFSDTLFKIYTKIGATTPQERAVNVTRRIRKLYNDDFFRADSLVEVGSENTVDIVYGDMILLSISDLDALINDNTKELLAKDYIAKIRNAITEERAKKSVLKVLLRIGLMILVVSVIGLLVWLIGKGYIKTTLYIALKKDLWLKNLSYKDYIFLTSDQELKLLSVVLRLIRWFLVAVLLYLVLPIVFSIFPFTRGWASMLFNLVWTPLKGVFISIWDFLPNLFSILVIYFVMKYVIRLVKYIFSEIESGRLKISGFHQDWAKPTFGIVRFLLYAFMFILIFPYLPGSSSNIFKGVSVFIGVLLSLGSSSAIANMVAGLVITYMRPFQIGDRIKIGEITGDVIEKNMLVTRVKTIKNEEITIPNSSVLSGNTVNYSSISRGEGLILYTSVTIGYNIPWKDMHLALIDAALRTDMILKQPMPFVLQTSLDDFFVCYQINAYTKNPGQQAFIYSELHKNIQDVCNERGLEILSPHFRAERDGNKTTIPDFYIPEDYTAPSFNVKLSAEDKNEAGNIKE